MRAAGRNLSPPKKAKTIGKSCVHEILKRFGRYPEEDEKTKPGEFQRSPEPGERFCVSLLPSNYETFHLSHSQFLYVRYFTILHVRYPIADIVREVEVVRDNEKSHA
jgi:hypothetical protein